MGTWKLKSYENKGSSANTERITNDVNDDDYNYSSNSSWTEKYDGTNLTFSNTSSVDWTDIYMWYDFAATPPKWKDQEVVYTEDSTSNSSQAYTFTISLYSDNSFEVTETTGNSSGSYAWSWDLSYDDNNMPGATDTDADDDDDWTETATNTLIQQGAWYWDEDSKEGKLFLNAGPIKGKIIRLSSKEMVVEVQYGPLKAVDQAVYGEGEETSDVGSGTDIDKDIDILEYDDTSPSDTKKGDETTATTWNNTETIGIMVFEKTDKENKRPAAQ